MFARFLAWFLAVGEYVSVGWVGLGDAGWVEGELGEWMFFVKGTFSMSIVWVAETTLWTAPAMSGSLRRLGIFEKVGTGRHRC